MGKCLIGWYKSGIQGLSPEMPGDGFSDWKYIEIASFLQKYSYACAEEQMNVFEILVAEIINIVERETINNNLDRIGVWPWCTLQSGKSWPLSKWIQVNSVAPYKRATKLIKQAKTVFNIT